MAQAKSMPHTGNAGLFIIGTVAYLSFIGLFLWQTAEFVNWLFPDDQVIYRIITVCVFDVMALFWACIDTFYRFATKASHELVKWAWTISFIAALVASVFYMVLQSFTRLNFTPDITWVDVGFGIVILVTVLQILFLTFWIRTEWMARHPKVNDYEYDVRLPETKIEQVPALPAPKAEKVLTPPAKELTPEPIKEKLPVFTPQPARVRRQIEEKKKAQEKKPLPRVRGRKFTPRTQAEFVETKEVATPAQAPLDRIQPPAEKNQVRIKKNRGEYIVNRRQVIGLPTHD